MSHTHEARRRVLVISHDVVGERMAGPGIRYFHLARVLAHEFSVALAAPATMPPPPDLPGFELIPYASADDPRLTTALARTDVVFAPAIFPASAPALLRGDAALIVDCYDPYLAETLAAVEGDFWGMLAALSQAYLAGDFFVCASERQRDWLLGLLEAHGRINSWQYAADPTLRRLVDVVPFGLPPTPPQRSRPVIKGVWPGVGPEDRLILWGGGVWPWLDPLTAVRAMAQVVEHDPAARLIFPGLRHPNPAMAAMTVFGERVQETARELGLLGRAVFCSDWVPFADWPAVLLESDAAITLHRETLEARLAYRSRVLDYIWAGVPVVATGGDAASELVAHYGLGRVVAPGDVEGVAAALLAVLAVPRMAWEGAFARARSDLTWEQAARPLIEFCRQPRRAPDKAALGPRLGNAFYLAQAEQLAAERDAWRTEAARHEWESRRWQGLAELHLQERDYWRSTAEQLGQERDEWRWQAEFQAQQVAGYERGRFIRLMKRLHAWRRRLQGRPKTGV